MRKVTIILFIFYLISSVLMAQDFRSSVVKRLADDGWDVEFLDTGMGADYLSDAEKDVLLLMNACRHNPPKFAQIYVHEYRGWYRGNTLERPGDIRITTREGTRVVDELYRQMMDAPSRSIFYPSEGMSRAAADHVEDQGPSGQTGHNGRDGSRFIDRIERYGSWDGRVGENISYGYDDGFGIVIQLLVDDGVSSRGHRKNIYHREFNLVGIAIGSHSKYEFMCVIEYAGEYQDK